MSATLDQIRELEWSGFRAWPALKTHIYDGWYLRFADGYSKRNNSINPMGAGTLNLAEKIAHCEEIYKQHGQSAHFRLTAASLPSELDNWLAQHGYQRWDETEVQICVLSQQQMSLDARFRWEPEPSEAWIAAYCAMNSVSSRRQQALSRILEQIKPYTCYGWLGDAAVGLGVLEGTRIGLFDIVVREDARGRGIGQALVNSLLAWGKERSANTAYLQVVATNTPAMRLYKKLGFQRHHRYWYRTKQS